MRGNLTTGKATAPTAIFDCASFGFDANTAQNDLCAAQDFCGTSGFSGAGIPNQWWRFISPAFEHVGIIHLLFNMLFQCTAGFQLEREHGTWQLALIWLLSGVGGNIFGANFAAPYSRTIPLLLLDFLYVVDC